MASLKLKKFLEENFNWTEDDDAIEGNEMLTEAIIMYRVVKTDDPGDELPERVSYTTSRSCGLTMAIGIVYQVQAGWDYEFLTKMEDDDGEES